MTGLPWSGDDPDADWTDDYAWTRYRGPQPWPCPGDWVLNIIEEGGAMWYRYPDVGEGLGTDDDVRDAFDPDFEAYNDARGESASLFPKTIEFNMSARTETQEWELKIAGESIFRRVEPDHEDMLAATAEALSRYPSSDSLEDVHPSTGRLPEDIREQQEVEQREAENQSLGDFA